MQDGGDELDFLGHAFAEVRHFSVPPTFHFQPLKPALQFALGLLAVHATQAGEVQDLLRDAHAFVEAALLRQVTHARQQRPVVGLPPHAQGAGVGLGDAGDHPQQRGFARAVGAEQPHNASLLDVHIKRRQRHVVAKRLANAFGVEDWGGHRHENMSRTLSKNPRSSWSGSG